MLMVYHQALQATEIPDFALTMYEESDNVKMTPQNTPVRSQSIDMPSSSSSMVIPPSAMSIVNPSDLSIAPTIGVGNVVKTLWSDEDEFPNGDRGRSHLSAMSDGGSFDTTMEIATPTVREHSFSSGDATELGNSHSRRRGRNYFNEVNAPNGRPLPAVDLIRTRAMSVDNTIACPVQVVDVDDVVSPFKKSRATNEDNTERCTLDNK